MVRPERVTSRLSNRMDVTLHRAGRPATRNDTRPGRTLLAETLATQFALDQERLASSEESTAAGLAVQQAELDQRRGIAAFRRSQVDALRVRAGVAGVLQQVPVEVGQRVAPGTNLARIADPARLNAHIRIPETQMRDVAIGQLADIDTHNGIVKGRVARIDPGAQNGAVTVHVVPDEPLPRGARPDMNVEGTIQLERLDDVLHVGRPVFGQDHSTTTLFKVDPDGRAATRVRVEFGRGSVAAIKVTRGLTVGDRVVLSDMSAWDEYDRILLR